VLNNILNSVNTHVENMVAEEKNIIKAFYYGTAGIEGVLIFVNSGVARLTIL
jgi:hypothetical protein